MSSGLGPAEVVPTYLKAILRLVARSAAADGNGCSDMRLGLHPLPK
jgi:hypothetical protein